MYDPTEITRRSMVAEINHEPGSKEALQSEYGDVYDTSEAQEHFEFIGFMAPFAVVRKKSDGIKGSIMFQDYPRFYFKFQPE